MGCKINRWPICPFSSRTGRHGAFSKIEIIVSPPRPAMTISSASSGERPDNPSQSRNSTWVPRACRLATQSGPSRKSVAMTRGERPDRIRKTGSRAWSVPISATRTPGRTKQEIKRNRAESPGISGASRPANGNNKPPLFIVSSVAFNACAY